MCIRLWRVRRHLYWDRGLGSALCHNIACGGTRSVFRSSILKGGSHCGRHHQEDVRPRVTLCHSTPADQNSYLAVDASIISTSLALLNNPAKPPCESISPSTRLRTPRRARLFRIVRHHSHRRRRIRQAVRGGHGGLPWRDGGIPISRGGGVTSCPRIRLAIARSKPLGTSQLFCVREGCC